MLVVWHALQVVDVFARGGGGGSGGGGGGGSGGGSGGGGNILFFIGYLPTHFATSWLNKHVSRPAALVTGIVMTLAILVGFGFVDPFIGFLTGIGAAAGVWSGLSNLLSRLTRKMKVTKSIIAKASQRDGIWQEQALQDRIGSVFLTYQRDWSSFNLENMKTYTTPRYFDHMRLMLTALQQMGRQNAVGDPKLLSSMVIDAVDRDNNTEDNFTAYINGKAHDILVDTQTNSILYVDDNAFEEFWHFDREGNDWLLDGITQSTEDPIQSIKSLQGFAAEMGMYYSADMGWLLLPQRGQLFGKANFKNSDVNNHVIGEWQDLIVQLYTFIPFKARESADNYLIGQINLPKSYGGILIKRKGNLHWFERPPKGYIKVSLEWPDFNNRYQVYATDMDKVTSFELLNPKFMADLYDGNLPMNIEVVDNVVYIYARTNKATTYYPDMLGVLAVAFKELKK